MSSPPNPEALVPLFKLERILNQDQAGRRISLYGTINTLPSILILERAPFPGSSEYIASIPATLLQIKNLGSNDIYSWFMATTGSSIANINTTTTEATTTKATTTEATPPQVDLKLNLIHPCTPLHIKKYTVQPVRYILETPTIYHTHVVPYMRSKRVAGRLNWVYNILDGVKEAEDVIYRSWAPAPTTTASTSTDTAAADTDVAITEGKGKEGESDDESTNENFLLLPDLNWDRSTLSTLRLLCLPARRDIWSLRDLKPSHVPWLEHIRAKVITATCAHFNSHDGNRVPRADAGKMLDSDKGKDNAENNPDTARLEPDQLKLYFHYHPTYYHLHIHVVHVGLEAGATQATGKAVGMESVIEMLKVMGDIDGKGGSAGGEGAKGGKDERGMDSVTIGYSVGEAHELWTKIFLPLKEGREPQAEW